MVDWKNSLKYLGVVFVAGVVLCIDINVISRQLYAACRSNSVYSNATCLTELAKLHLLESYIVCVFLRMPLVP